MPLEPLSGLEVPLTQIPRYLVPFLTVLCGLGLWYATQHGMPTALAVALATLVPGLDSAVRSLQPLTVPPEGMRPPPPPNEPLGFVDLGDGKPPIPKLPLAGGGRPTGLVGGLLVLLLSAGCATTWGQALAACGLQQAPQAATSAVALALHKGDGWESALASLVGTYGRCVVDALVQAHADGQGPPPPQVAVAAEALTGELEAAARPPRVSREEAQRRARDWLGHRR